jgi:hypothetical protein
VFWLKNDAATGIVGGAAYAAAQGAVRKIPDPFPSIKAEVEEDPETEDRSSHHAESTALGHDAGNVPVSEGIALVPAVFDPRWCRLRHQCAPVLK